MASREKYRSYCWRIATGRLFLAGALLVGMPMIVSSGAETPDSSVVNGAKQFSPAEAAARIDALRAEIAYHDELYFKKAAPVISDFAYDQLKRELAELEQAFPDAKREGGSLAGVGDDRTGGFASGRHRVRMLSLNKSYTEAEMRAFDARLMKQLSRSELEYVVEPKYDGLAISVTFEKGVLARAVTRGNGEEGDDVTANVRAIRSLPRRLQANELENPEAVPVPEMIELRGEVYLTYAEFARINREREERGDLPFANPRNLAAGTLKQLDSAEVAKRRLEIVFYGVGGCEPVQARPKSQLALLHQLREWGLPTIDAPRTAQGAEAMWRAVQAVERERGRLGFPIDGVVVKLNEVALQERSGATQQAPLWAMAYKFSPERAETQLRAITLQMGRTGVITPVAELAPVRLGGSTVAWASLYNGDEIARRDIRVGDFVFIEKAGEIIPVIAGVNRAKRGPGSTPYVFPADCPVCRSGLVREVGEAAWRCPNTACPAQVKRRVEHFASAAGVNIAGLGPVVADRLVQHGLVRNVSDLYRLRREDLLLSGGWSGKSADRLLDAIERSKHAELGRFIHGLGIPQVGPATARELARRFDGLIELSQALREDFMKDDRPLISGVGESAARALLAYFAVPENRRVMENLLTLGVRPLKPTARSELPLAGKIFVLTGKLPNLTRAEATEKIAAAGGTVGSSVTRRTDYLLAGEDGGEKVGTARLLGVPIITESDLRALLEREQLLHRLP